MEKGYLPAGEIQRRLAVSREKSEEGEFRRINCPVCHRYLVGVYSHNSELIKVKCPHCGFNDPIDIRLFRTQKGKRRETFEEFMARYQDEGCIGRADTSFREEMR